MTDDRPLGFYLRVLAAAYLLWAVFFLTAGHLAAMLPSQDLRTPIDRAIPLWEWTVWIYDFCYLVPLFAVFAVRDGHVLNRLLLAIYTATVTACVIYFLIPISYPEPVFSDSLSGRFLHWQFRVDFQPGANKMPSLHVANSFMVWLAVRASSRRWSVPFLVLAILIAASTLTTKKHLVGDVALGLFWAFGAWAVAGRLQQRWMDLSLTPRESLVRFVRRRPTAPPA